MNVADLGARETFLADIIIAACTPLNGGIRYWADVDAFAWCRAGSSSGPHGDRLGLSPHGGANAYARVINLADEEEPAFELTPQAVAKALRAVQEHRGGVVMGSWRRRIVRARRHNDASLLDADDADALVQLALFGEVRYL